jgi:hypothetical protein
MVGKSESEPIKIATKLVRPAIVSLLNSYLSMGYLRKRYAGCANASPTRVAPNRSIISPS